MKALIFTIQLLLFLNMAGFAQPGKDKLPVMLIARSYPDHIVLRYFPTSPALMDKANSLGYIVEKAAYKAGLPVEKQVFSAVKGSPFKRWNNDRWEKALNETDKKDTTQIQLAGFAMTLSDENVKPAADIMANGLQTLMQARDDQDMKFAMALIAANRSKLAAEGLALSITDNEVKPGSVYVYRVRINDPAAGITGAAYIKIKCGDFNARYLFNNKVIKLTEGDNKVTFSFPGSTEYYAFNGERSDDGGATYKKITATPAFKLTPHGYTGKTDYGFTDSNLVNYKKYRYRVLVSTLFADELPLAEFTATPRDRTPPPPPFLRSVKQIKPTQVELVWDAQPASDLQGFNIKRSSSFKGKYTLISKTVLAPAARTYIDETFDANGSNYYLVEAVDTAGNTSSSFAAYVTLIDSIPPAMPVISSARIDTAGKIVIKVKPNTEKDFIGYQLLKANAPDHEFSGTAETYLDSSGRKIFTLKDSTTLNTLTKKIYYKVIAFDSHYNQSLPSKTIELKKRDTIPPVPPLITGFAVTDSTIVISFANSSSDDAVSNILLRRESGASKFDTVFINKDDKVSRFIDQKIMGGRQYEYAMISRDDGGLRSKISRSIVLKAKLNDRLPAPVISGVYNGNTKKIALSFLTDEKLNGRKIKVEIYKRSNKLSTWAAYKQIDLVAGKAFLDDVENTAKSVFYTIRLTDNKRVSNFSNELEIDYQ